MTTRKAQGATLDGAVLYMDMMFRPASQGYAYVGASRVKHHSQLFCYGTVQRSDWIPVGEPMSDDEGSDADRRPFAVVAICSCGHLQFAQAKLDRT